MKVLPAALMVLLLVSCTTGSTAYFAGLDRDNSYKRNLLVSRVVTAKDHQETARQELGALLEQFYQTAAYGAGECRQAYAPLSNAYQRTRAAVDEVQRRNRNVHEAGAKVFRIWDREIEAFTDPGLADASRTQRDLTRGQFAELAAAMGRADTLYDPVLSEIHDRVIYLKFNRHDEGLATLADQSGSVSRDVHRLLRELDGSIEAAGTFIREVTPAGN